MADKEVADTPHPNTAQEQSMDDEDAIFRFGEFALELTSSINQEADDQQKQLILLGTVDNVVAKARKTDYFPELLDTIQTLRHQLPASEDEDLDAFIQRENEEAARDSKEVPQEGVEVPQEGVKVIQESVKVSQEAVEVVQDVMHEVASPTKHDIAEERRAEAAMELLELGTDQMDVDTGSAQLPSASNSKNKPATKAANKKKKSSGSKNKPATEVATKKKKASGSKTKRAEPSKVALKMISFAITPNLDIDALTEARGEFVDLLTDAVIPATRGRPALTFTPDMVSHFANFFYGTLYSRDGYNCWAGTVREHINPDELQPSLESMMLQERAAANPQLPNAVRDVIVAYNPLARYDEREFRPQTAKLRALHDRRLFHDSYVNCIRLARKGDPEILALLPPCKQTATVAARVRTFICEATGADPAQLKTHITTGKLVTKFENRLGSGVFMLFPINWNSVIHKHGSTRMDTAVRTFLQTTESGEFTKFRKVLSERFVNPMLSGHTLPTRDLPSARSVTKSDFFNHIDATLPQGSSVEISRLGRNEDTNMADAQDGEEAEAEADADMLTDSSDDDESDGENQNDGKVDSSESDEE